MVRSGVDPKLPDRRLGLIRLGPPPGGPKTAAMVGEFESLGTGYWLEPLERDLAVMAALAALAESPPPDRLEWLRRRQPAFEAAFAAPLLRWLAGQDAAPSRPAAPDSPPVESPPPGVAPPGSAGSPAAAGGAPAESFPGSPILGGPSGEPVADPPSGSLILGAPVDDDEGPVSLRTADLVYHTVVFGGTGTGKSMLLKRLVDEAALQGVPAVVLGGGDLCLLGRPWPEPPGFWLPGDAERAGRLGREVETIVWTPGQAKGNPLNFRIIPDFSAVVDPERALGDTVADLGGLIKDKTSSSEDAVLKRTLEHLIEKGGPVGLGDLARTLENLPPKVVRDLFAKAAKIGSKLGELLKAALVNDKNLLKDDTVEIPQLLRSPSGKTRISVINLDFLGAEKLVQSFVLRLIDRLFDWMTRHPPEGGRLSGLLVVDEARDLAPSKGDLPAKRALLRLSNQSRKYGFGLILASQQFKSLDHNLVANCRTLLVGRQGSPASRDAANEHLGFGFDVGSLENRQFYLKVPAGDDQAPVRLFSPAFSLSRHVKSAPGPDEIVRLAAACRELV
jgi:hypothetical protein